MGELPEQDSKIVTGEKTTSLEKFWIESIREIKKESISRVEEAGKQLISVITLSQTIYFAAVSFSEAKKSLNLINHRAFYWIFIIVLIAPLLLWIVSLVFAVKVFKPEEYDTNLESPTKAQSAIDTAFNNKNRNLQKSFRFLFVGFLLVLITLFIYLGFVPTPPSDK